MPYRLLNLACGSKISHIGAWTNVDFQSPVDDVIETNILEGLAFPDATFDAVYSAQFIEHLTLEDGLKVLKEIARVMKPGGLLRLVTPDLEELTRTYLELLAQLKSAKNSETVGRYDWVRIELFDQIARDYSGGDTQAFLADCTESTRSYLVERIGYTAKNMLLTETFEWRNVTLSMLLLKINRLPRKLWRHLLNFFATEALKIGRFRQSGEVHRYVHDIFSLTRLLHNAGFHSVERVDANHSSIPDWQQYELDIIGGVVDGPLALYVEARL